MEPRLIYWLLRAQIGRRGTCPAQHRQGNVQNRRALPHANDNRLSGRRRPHTKLQKKKGSLAEMRIQMDLSPQCMHRSEEEYSGNTQGGNAFAEG